ncbi:E3 ubiquitin-protein ligase MYCBP2-like isoform X2 [Temnothorax nylanderi]|uniref:E3 ubiquitin-protein ligase MYCBP2-like isoform X2 n=1 Tax=Temnothorax nylanderi TaxID=102681 RepID=UPI003A86A3BD
MAMERHRQKLRGECQEVLRQRIPKVGHQDFIALLPVQSQYPLGPVDSQLFLTIASSLLLLTHQELYEDVRRKALMRLEYEGLHKAEGAFASGGRYQDPAAYAMERYAYYVCYKCQKAYLYGGEARCDAQVGGESFDPAELVCGGCSDKGTDVPETRGRLPRV